jgi:hypothetical protein
MEGDIPVNANIKELASWRIGPRKRDYAKSILEAIHSIEMAERNHELDEIVELILTNKIFSKQGEGGLFNGNDVSPPKSSENNGFYYANSFCSPRKKFLRSVSDLSNSIERSINKPRKIIPGWSDY